MENLIYWGGLLAAYTIWLIVDLIKNKGKSMTKIVRRAIIFLTISCWFVYLIFYGNLFSNTPNYEGFQYIVGIVFMVMMWSFVAQHVNIKKGTPEFQLIIGCILFLLISVVAITILVLT